MQWKASEERWHHDEAIKSTFKDSERCKAVDSRIKLKLTEVLLSIISALHNRLTQRPHIKECASGRFTHGPFGALCKFLVYA